MSTRRRYVVSPLKIAAARRLGLGFPVLVAIAAGLAGIPYRIACAVIMQESGGRNVYGGADGSDATLSGFGAVTRHNYPVFFYLVVVQQFQSNGVGPAQITFWDYHRDAAERGYKLWRPLHNLRYAFAYILGPHFDDADDWREAVRRYNSLMPSETSEKYADEVMARVDVFADEFGEAA